MTKTPRRPAPSRPPGAAIAGRATAAGTSRFAERHAARFAADYFRPFTAAQLRVSSIGLGTYLGECTADDDRDYAESAHFAVASGLSLIDTAINYRCQRSERAVSRALSRAVRERTAARDEIVVCTKGGYIPLDDVPPASREEYQAYVEREYFATGLARPEDVVGGAHCIAPTFLAAQIERSRTNLGLDTIDLYYVHNPEQQLDAITPAQLATRLRAAFEMLEQQCDAGAIGAYGCATWNGLRAAPGSRGHLNLADIVSIARDICGDRHHFAAVQLPLNLALTEAVRLPTQQLGAHTVPVLEAAAELGVAVIASASLLQGKLAHHLPATVHEALPGFSTDAQRAIGFVRSLPMVTAALVGTKSVRHLHENLAAARRG
ncbi:MAG TPA: aldo/keto reductase [Gemmatimonadaceae bacterium]|nr:aldo/keto reductase [Gemmatimonadaceae bacterium]